VVAVALLASVAWAAPEWRETGRFLLDGEPAESLDGALVAADGTVLAWGNAWDTPAAHPAVALDAIGREPDAKPSLLGERPELASLSAPDDPLRTGFFVELGADLKPKGGARFPTGLATVDAATFAADGGLITAGSARKGFDALVPPAKLRVVAPRSNDARFGKIVCRGVEMPGDVYVARWRADRRGIEWAVLLKAHRKPPETLSFGADGRLYFQSRSLYALAADGTAQDLGWAEGPAETSSRSFAAAHPSRDALLSCGWKVTSDGGRQWVGPVVEELNLAGKPRQRFYDWTGALVGCHGIGLTHPCPIVHGAWMPDGAIVVAACTRAEKVVLTADATDPTVLLKSAKDSSPIEPLPWHLTVERAPRGIHFARFDPRAAGKGVWTRLMSPDAEKHWVGELVMSGMSAAPDGRLAVCGEMDLVELFGDGVRNRAMASDSQGFVAVLAPDLTVLLRPMPLPGMLARRATLSGPDMLVAGCLVEKRKKGSTERAVKPAIGCLLKLSP
jgi:hypothetical protein